MRTVFLLITILLILVGCDCETECNTDNYIYLNDTTLFTFQQSRFNPSEGFYLTFDSLISDSRCPLNVECIWEGYAAVKFTYSGSNVDTSFILNTNGKNQFLNNVTVNGLIFILTSVEPYPEFPSSTPMEDYTCSMVVKRIN